MPRPDLSPSWAWPAETAFAFALTGNISCQPSEREASMERKEEQELPVDEEVTEPTEDEHPSSPGVGPDDNQSNG